MAKIHTSLPTHDLPSLLTLLLTAALAGFSPPHAVDFHRPSPPGSGELVINEILYAPGAGGREFVELYNRSVRTLNLSSVRLSDSRRDPAALQGEQFLLPPGAFAVIADDAAGISGAAGDAFTFHVESWPALNNGGDTVILFTGSTVIDSAAYESDFGAPDRSIERIDPYGPSSHPTNWAPSTAAAGSTPGRQNSVFERDTIAPELLLAEESSSTTVTLTFDEPLLQPPERSAVACSPALGITDIRAGENRQEVILRFSAPLQARRCTIAPVQDLSENRSDPVTFPLAYMPDPHDLAITELMYQPLADPFDARPDQPEYLELFNRSDTPVTTTGMYWTDHPDEDGSADTTYLPPTTTAIPAAGYAVIVADPQGTDGAALRRAFPGPTGPVLLSIQTQSLGLGNDGEAVRLHSSRGEVIDSLRYDPNWHHPDLIDPRGTALERITIDGPSDTPDNWSSSVDPTGGSPGRTNSVDAPVRPAAEAGGLHVDPSPFSPNGDGYDDHTVLSYELPARHASVRIRIFDARGRLVRTLMPARLSGGADLITWDGRDDRERQLPAGIYLVLLEAVDAGGGRVTRHRAPVVIGN